MQAFWWRIVGLYLRIFYRLNVHGVECLPTCGPYVLVSNHASHLDALVLVSVVRRSLRANIYPLAAGDTFFNSLFSSAFSAAALNALPIWRRSPARHAIEDLRTRLFDEGAVFILFPEGTRTRDGRLAAFRAGVGIMLAETDVAIFPCNLRGTFEAWPAHRSWPRRHPVDLLIGAPIQARDYPNAREGWERLARALQQKVAALAETPLDGPADGETAS